MKMKAKKKKNKSKDWFESLKREIFLYPRVHSSHTSTYTHTDTLYAIKLDLFFFSFSL